MKKLAIITSHPIQYNAPLFELLASRGKIAVKVFYTWGEGVLKDKFDPGFGKVIKWDIPLLKGYEYQFVENVSAKPGSHHFKGIVNPGLIGLIKNYSPDAILVYGWAFDSHLKLLKYFKGKVPVMFRGDSHFHGSKAGIKSLLRRVYLRMAVYRHVDLAFFVGKHNYEYFRLAGLKESQLLFAPHVVDNDRFACNDQTCLAEAAGLRRKLNIGEDELVFLFAGKLEPVKDPELLLSAFTQVGLPQHAHLVVAGNGPLEAGIRERYGNAPNVHFLGFQNQLQMPALYGMADVFVLCSKSETWGLSINEAMANGKALIISDACGAAADLVENGVNGILFSSGDQEGLGQALKKLALDPTLVESMKACSKKKIRDFSLDKVAAVIETAVMDRSQHVNHNVI